MRVRDGAIVQLTDQLARLSADCTLAPDQDTAFLNFDRASNTSSELNSRVGEVLKELDLLEDIELDRLKN